LPPTFWAACTGGQYHDIKTMQSDEKGEFAFLQRYLAEGLKPDYWWIDAGWYPTRSNHWWDVGTWETDPKRFPRGIRSIANEVHARGMKLILWFEPERVAEGTWLAIHHPEWLLKRPNSPQGEKLLDLGNPAARRWLTDRVHNLIQEQGVDVYRHDFNCQPLDYWRKNDAPDRQGITEIKYLTGLLAYYDDLLRRNPRLLIDNCSSGGCRNDLDMLRRSIPLWRSDLWNDALGAQNVTHALSFWLPYHSTGSQIMDGYTVSSHLTTHYNAGWDVRKKDVDYGLLRHLLKKHQETAPYYTGDYYPLTSYSLEERVWMAWQFDRPDLGAGLVQVFRRPACPEETLRVKLQGLQAAARYTVSGREGLRPSDTDGKSLMENGLLLSVKDRPGALTITYKRKT
jgi:alpha-galactosidase